MYNPLITPVIYSRKLKNKPLKLSNGLYRIEAIPVGAFVKDNAKSGAEHERIPFEVDDNTLNHWKNTFEEMKYNGIEVPMPLNHTEDPEARRATVVDFEIGKNKEGRNSLFAIFKPKNDQVIETLKDTSVSIYVPPKFVDGKGNEYIYPIRHVAFTDYPVIPGLEKMQPVPIAASYVETKGKKNMAKVGKEKEEEKEEGKEEGYEEGMEKEEEKEEGMEEGGEEGSAEVTINDLREIAAKLGLEGIPDNKLLVAINHVIDAILESVDEGEEGGEHGEENEEGEHNEGKKGVGAVAHRIEHKEEHYHPPISAGFISLGRKSRLQEINDAARGGFITPKTRDTLINRYCTDDALQLAFSPEGDIIDDFDSVMELIRSNGKVVKLGEEKGKGGAVALSYSDLLKNTNSNPLLADAEKRAKQAGQA